MAKHRASGVGVGVVDIGSNSVRFVVFDRTHRHPVVLLNDKQACRLGDFTPDGRLNPEAKLLVRDALQRFLAVRDEIDLDEMLIVATAAVRSAADGPAFADEIAAMCGVPVRVVDGEEEAVLAASGVICGIQSPRGLVADLGGGSLELAAVDGDAIGKRASKGLGHLRLSGMIHSVKSGIAEAEALIAATLDDEPWIAEHAGEAIYLVGGAWRALAKAHMVRSELLKKRPPNYPIEILHEYTMPARHALRFAGEAAQIKPADLQRTTTMGNDRAMSVAGAALVLKALMERSGAKEAVVSAAGVREGVFYTSLPDDLKKQDALISAASLAERRRSRSAGLGEALNDWVEPLFCDDPPERRRLRLAAALSADLGWRLHPDHRAEIASQDVLFEPWSAIQHRERLMVALAVARRHKRPLLSLTLDGIIERFGLTEEEVRWSERLGLAFRLAFEVCQSTPSLLQASRLSNDDRKLWLHLRGPARHMLSVSVRRRLKALAEAFDCDQDVDPG